MPPPPPWSLRPVPLQSLSPHETLQLRHGGTHYPTVLKYAEAMKDGDQFPPLDVAQVGKRLYIIDGHHRAAAAETSGRKQIECRVARMSLEAAQALALVANTIHGKPLTTKDKRNIWNAYIAQGRHLLPGSATTRKCKSLATIHREIGGTYSRGYISPLLKAMDLKPDQSDVSKPWSSRDEYLADLEAEETESETLDALRTALSAALDAYALLDTPDARAEAQRVAQTTLEAIAAERINLLDI